MIKSVIKNIIHNLFFINNLKLLKLKNKHLGETCYIIGDGGELNFYDLKLFDNHPAICFNFSYMRNEIINRKSIFYSTWIEPYYFIKHYFTQNKDRKPIKNLLRYIAKEAKKREFPFFISATNIFNFTGKKTIKTFYKLPNDKFTESLLNTNYKFNQGSLQHALSLARYLGFENIVLLGISLHHKGYFGHWYEDKNLIRTHDMNFTNYKKIIESQYSKDGFDFFNSIIKEFKSIRLITPEKSNSLFFETITYKELTGFETNLKENKELADEKFIRLITDFCMKN